MQIGNMTFANVRVHPSIKYLQTQYFRPLPLLPELRVG